LLSRFLLEKLVVVMTPLGPRFREVEVHLDGLGKGVVGVVDVTELGDEHAFEREELGLLAGRKVHEVRRAD
jgi:hypothetical protein